MKEKVILPLPEEINKMSVEELGELEEFVEARIESITTSLQFDDGDEEWYGRAKGALTSHQICLKNVRKAIHRRTNKKGVAEHVALMAKQHELKAHAAEQNKQKQLLVIENKRAEAEKKQALRDLEKQNLIKRLSYANTFHRVCLENLPKEQFLELAKLAEEKLEIKLKREIGEETNIGV